MESVGTTKDLSELLAFKKSMQATIKAHASSSIVEREIDRYRGMTEPRIDAEARADEDTLIAEEEQVCREWKVNRRCACVARLDAHDLPTCHHIEKVLKKRNKEIRTRALARTLLGIETTALRVHLAQGAEDF